MKNPVFKIPQALLDRRHFALGGALIALAAWVFSRVATVNPAILGDEYLYSLNARHAAPWAASPAGDFSNYLFNLVYSSTNLCGEAFYTCGKILNLGFFLAFLVVVFIISRRFLNYWVSAAFTIAAGLSPLSVYTSMFLPESMYFFMIALVFLAALKAGETYSWKAWAVVGLLIGTASLVKPHAWLSAIAIGIFLVVLGISNSSHRFRPMFRAIGAVSLGAILGRVIVGLIVGGPRALGFFGQYLGLDTVNVVAQGAGEPVAEGQSAVGTTPINGVISLFGIQLNVHMLTVSALMGVALIGLSIGLLELIRTRELTPVTNLSLLVFIWLFSLVLEIVIFTGWITGGGDDHTTRVLERYYDFLFVFVPLAGLAVFTTKFSQDVKLWLRWVLAGLILLLITPAFSGFFGTLTIQIADAPNLAGLVVNMDVFNGAALVSVLALLVFAFFPKYTVWTFALILPFTMIGTGYQIQDQYQGFRGQLSSQDIAGQFLKANFPVEDIDATWVIATSRFEATNVAIWADSTELKFDLFGPGSVLDPTLAPEQTKWILATGGLTVAGDFLEELPGDGFVLYRLR